LGVGCLYFYLGKDAEGGNNLVLESLQQPAKRIPLKMAPLVYIGTVVTHLFGGSAGREGTAVQMSGAAADKLGSLFNLSNPDRRILLIAAVAAGFGSVFGTPLAGAVFALEFFLTGRIKYEALFPAFAAAIIGEMVTRLWGLSHSVFVIPEIPPVDWKTILYSIFCGIVFGICAAAFSKSLHGLASLFKRTIKFPPLRPFVGGIIVATAAWFIGTRYLGLGIPVISEAFLGPVPQWDFILKLLFTIVTLGAGFKGGEVTPLFFIGAALGNALAWFIPMPVALLAGMGFVAVFSGATNTPLACTLMAMELFGTGCGVYVAIACVVSYLVSGQNSIYRSQVVGEPKHLVFRDDEGKKYSDL
jgi:H+/Cl- antiporter ClcA